MATKLSDQAAAPEAQLRSFNARLDPKQQKLFRSIRSALRKRFPMAHEIAYDYTRFFVLGYSPTDRGIDSVVSVAARPDRVELYFNHGPQIPDPKKLLKGSGKMTRFIPLESARQLSTPDVKGFIAAAISLSKIPFPKSKGTLIIKTNKTAIPKKKRTRSTSRT